MIPECKEYAQLTVIHIMVFWIVTLLPIRWILTLGFKSAALGSDLIMYACCRESVHETGGGKEMEPNSIDPPFLGSHDPFPQNLPI
jgi:hypothetical protein